MKLTKKTSGRKTTGATLSMTRNEAQELIGSLAKQFITNEKTKIKTEDGILLTIAVEEDPEKELLKERIKLLEDDNQKMNNAWGTLWKERAKGDKAKNEEKSQSSQNIYSEEN